MQVKMFNKAGGSLVLRNLWKPDLYTLTSVLSRNLL